jgi:hypothetical protein
MFCFHYPFYVTLADFGVTNISGTACPSGALSESPFFSGDRVAQYRTLFVPCTFLLIIVLSVLLRKFEDIKVLSETVNRRGTDNTMPKR